MLSMHQVMEETRLIRSFRAQVRKELAALAPDVRPREG
jgi:hypothetical protein